MFASLGEGNLQETFMLLIGNVQIYRFSKSISQSDVRKSSLKAAPCPQAPKRCFSKRSIDAIYNKYISELFNQNYVVVFKI